MNRFAFSYFGMQVGVEWVGAADLDQPLKSLLLPIWKDEPDLSPQAVFRISRDPQGELLIDGPDDEFDRSGREDIIETLERRLHFYLACLCREAIFVHAGVVGWRNGAVVIPGRSFAGKSTLTMALLEAGASYLSDEYAVIDRNGLIHPFPRPISLRTEDGCERVRPASVCLQPLPLLAMVSTEFSAGAEWSPDILSAGSSALEMLANTVSAQAAPELALECLSAALKNGVSWKGPRGEAKPTAEAILSQWTAH